MRSVERALLVLALVVAVATATLWGLREADVLRWGAGDASLARIEALEARIDALPAPEPRVTEGDLVRALARIEALEAQDAAASADRAVTLDRLASLEERTLGITESTLNVALGQLETRVGDRLAALEERAGAAGDLFLVAKVDWTVPDPMLARLCITYTVPGGVLERCERVGLVPAGDDLAEPAPVYAATVECWETARIGDPLPDCWR